MKKTLMAAALAFCVGAWAADTTRVTAPGGATTDYASLQAALNACTGGETVTMLTDATLTSQVKINADVTLDLDGHALVMTAYSDFIAFSSNLTATICGGTVEVRTARSLITVKEGTTVNVTNCTLKGYCMFYGNHATGRLNIMADTVALVDYPISGYSAAVLCRARCQCARMEGGERHLYLKHQNYGRMFDARSEFYGNAGRVCLWRHGRVRNAGRNNVHL